MKRKEEEKAKMEEDEEEVKVDPRNVKTAWHGVLFLVGGKKRVKKG